MSNGRVFFLSGHVKNIQDCWNKDNYFVKALVRVSYTDEDCHVSLALRGDDAFVLDALCDCKSSAMGRLFYCLQLEIIFYSLGLKPSHVQVYSANGIW